MIEFKTPENASEYLLRRYGLGSKASLAKWRTVGGGPEFRKIGRRVVYETHKLDEWALAKLSGPLRSTSDAAKEAA